MKKILITGAGGFIGSHLTERCAELGYEVRVFLHYNSVNSVGWLQDSSFKKNIEMYRGDIRDYDSTSKAMNGCDTVFHLAALIGIPYSYISPLAYIRTNIEGTYNVLQAARELEICNLMITSTSETYGTAQYTPIDEKHPMVGQSPYSASKIAADQLALSFYYSFGLPVKLVRPFNTYGPRQSARAIIPTILSQVLNGKTNIRVGNLTPTRDLTFVKDTVAGFLEIAKTDGLVGEVTNIGMNQEISVGDLIRLIGRILGEAIEIEEDCERIRSEKSEVQRLRCDNSKITSKTKWAPKYDLQRGIMETIEWIKNNLHHYKHEIYNV